MKKYLLKNLPILTFLLVLTSCFDIVEEINLEENGSGKMILTANLSKSKSKIASLMLLDSVNGYKVPDRAEIEKILNDAVKFLEEKNGISQVAKRVDFNNYIFAIECNFNSLENINGVIKELTEKNKLGVLTTSYNYNRPKQLLTKTYTQNPKFKTDFSKLATDDKKVFDNAYYTYIYRFPNEITSYTNRKATISKTKKAIMQKTLLLDLINGTSTITNQIKTK